MEMQKLKQTQKEKQKQMQRNQLDSKMNST
jgi:hypothetical protein